MLRVILPFLIFYSAAVSGQFEMISPDKQLRVQLQTGKRADSIMLFQVTNAKGIGLIKGHVGFDASTFKGQYRPGKPAKSAVATQWRPIYGERAVVPENYTQLVFRFIRSVDQTSVDQTSGGKASVDNTSGDKTFGKNTAGGKISTNNESHRRIPGYKNSENNPDTIYLICRLYNEGFAYQYRITSTDSITVTRETSGFITVGSSIAWSSKRAQSVITQAAVNTIADTVERPLTLAIPSGQFLALGEAGLVDYSRMKFAANRSDTLSCALDGPSKGFRTLTSPWRYVLCADSPGQLISKNYLLENLNPPSAIRDVSWIRPGKILREVTLTTRGAINCIDFAAVHDISYICFDAGWYGREDSDTSDATRVALDPARSKGPLELQQVIAYGKKHNVGIWLYVNRRALERQLDTLLPLYQSWGIKGIKFGFVQVGSQKVTAWLHEAIMKAAKHQLMVDVHDEYRPTGFSRTYPNLLTQEGIRGDEESPATEHSIATVFTRMIAGAADNTNCYFNERVDKMGSHVAQMAKTVCLYSPLQFLYWYDKPRAASASGTAGPGEILMVPDLDWYDKLPVTWQESQVLEGDINRFVTIARRNGGNWFIGGLNGHETRRFNINLKFLKPGIKYVARIYTDDPSLGSATNVKLEEKAVDQSTVLAFDVAPRHGVAIRITPA